MKEIIVILGFILISGCASYQSECLQLENLIFKDAGCESGLAGAGITGHAPSCLSGEDAEEISSICPNFKQWLKTKSKESKAQTDELLEGKKK